jgi:hypothetical protein
MLHLSRQFAVFFQHIAQRLAALASGTARK